MKKLKHLVKFGGHTYPYLAALILMALSIPVSALILRAAVFTGLPIKMVPMTLIPLGIGIAVFVLTRLLFTMWFRRLTEEERSLIENAEPAEFRQATEAEREEVRRQKDDSMAGWLAVILFLPAGFIALAGVRSKNDFSFRDLLIPLGILGTMAALVIIITKAVTGFWKKIDERAEAAVIPVTRCYSVTSHTRGGGRIYRHYAVCYLPDGRYILPIDRSRTDRVTVVRYRKRYCILSQEVQ